MAAHETSYVWAHHDFVAENDDEVGFCAGDRIQVIENDDLCGDGWWRGRIPSGKVGLFPKAYISRDPPALAHGDLSKESWATDRTAAVAIAEQPVSDTDPNVSAGAAPRVNDREGTRSEVATFSPADSTSIMLPYCIGITIASTATSLVSLPAPETPSVYSPSIAPQEIGDHAPISAPTTPPTDSASLSEISPAQWTVPQVIAWLESKGFDANVQRAFEENDIAGDVLIELDAAELKEDIGIASLGKRKRILKAIAELNQNNAELSGEAMGSNRPVIVQEKQLQFGHVSYHLVAAPHGSLDFLLQHWPAPLLLAPTNSALEWEEYLRNEDEGHMVSLFASSRKPQTLIANPSPSG
jgi:hypothetical protein